MDGDALLSLCREALALGGEDAEVYAVSRDRGCARFACGELSQHMEIEEPLVVVRVAKGKRVAEAQTTRLHARDIADAIGRAAKAAPLLPESESFPGFAPAGDPAPKPLRFASDTAEATPERRTEMLAPVLSGIREARAFVSGGDARVPARGVGRCDERGVRAGRTTGRSRASRCGRSRRRAPAALRGTADTSTGASQRSTSRARRSARSACASWRPTPWSSTRAATTWCSSPPAVSELLEWLSGIAFGAPEVEQGSSPMKLGQRITGENVTILEDAVGDDPAFGFGAPFDREGTARRPITLIERGVARSILYDRTYAARAGTASTGSAQLGETGGHGARSGRPTCG